METVVSEIGEEHQNTFTFARVDIDKNPQTLRKYQIRGTPTYIVFKDKKVVRRFGGEMSKAQLLQRILTAINN